MTGAMLAGLTLAASLGGLMLGCALALLAVGPGIFFDGPRPRAGHEVPTPRWRAPSEPWLDVQELDVPSEAVIGQRGHP